MAARPDDVAVDVAILHPDPGVDAGPLTRTTSAARLASAETHVRGFLAVGAMRPAIVSGPPDGRSFGARLRDLVADLGTGGLIVLGSGAIPLATDRDRGELVDAARGDGPRALTNNRYSGDVIAVARAREVLTGLPDLATDNALPRWLAENGVPVEDRRRQWRLGVDIDGPLDLVLLGGRWAAHLQVADRAAVDGSLARIRAVIEDPSAELIVAGRVSAANLAWLEARTASRTRALVEERGLRTRRDGQRPAASVLGALLDRDGPGSLGEHLTRLGEAAIVDTRVLLAHRFGADEAGWPVAEDRFASDLLLADRVADPWLRELTAAAVAAPIPVLLGGHTLVGPGLRLALGRGRGLAALGRHGASIDA
jgi:hypothetical protein